MLAVDVGGWGGGRQRVKLCRKGGQISEGGRKMAHYCRELLWSAHTHTHVQTLHQCDLDMVLTGPVLLKAHFALRVFISADLCADGIAGAVPLTLQQGALYLEGASWREAARRWR